MRLKMPSTRRKTASVSSHHHFRFRARSQIRMEVRARATIEAIVMHTVHSNSRRESRLAGLSSFSSQPRGWEIHTFPCQLILLREGHETSALLVLVLGSELRLVVEGR